MSLTDTDKPKDSELTVLSEKPLDGDWVLRKMRVHSKSLINDTRLFLSKAGLKTGSIFGGETASFISAKDCDDYFDRIESSADFIAFSERIRQQLLMVI